VLVPTRDIQGSRGAEMRIPVNGGLWGHEVEFSTVGEEVYGRLIVQQNREDIPATPQSPQAGLNWWASVSFASTVPLTNDEWRRFCGEARIEVLSGANKVMK